MYNISKETYAEKEQKQKGAIDNMKQMKRAKMEDLPTLQLQAQHWEE